ncbi:FAD-dependent oxidoreductase [Actinophytocola algeriensis]|uniref:Protoporphyrinogen oxidase n=1 Tax=Actinophytocola algeriensis TaxID=1768010 RepID=A0A7W7VDC7_9PSEU|nr:FAD-dependent oxidoreductase [Actinophytocola algeriensis]MBB4905954.1 protoporphyrinogen oxidase [Actinophytocola algeriensis]MBE1472361.1 protoporphyrinogen oxidase [Actinophytocola algeriensis]
MAGTSTTARHVAVLGGGICGLATAHRLTRSGHRVTLLEGSAQLGGLGTYFPWRDGWVERFYHCVMPSDDELLGLLAELGLADEVRWRRTDMGMIVDGEHHAFNTARDLLRFTPLGLPDRLRFGVVSLLLRRLGRGKDLDNTRTEDWLRGLYGNAVWETLLAPMFGSKFGRSFGDVPALYLWQRLGRDGNVATRGYPARGYKSVIDGLRAALEAGGARVRTSAPVQRLSVVDGSARITLPDKEMVEADQVVSTLPLPRLRQLADDDLATRLPTGRLPYQGVVNALFFLRRPLAGHYWTPVVRSGTEFDGVVEMSALAGTAPYGGRHLAYAMRYTDRESALYQEDDDRIAARWTAQLRTLYSGLSLTADDIDEVHVFKAPFVEPVYPLGYLRQRPPIELPGTPLLLATTAHVYPEVTSWNSSVRLANQVAATIDGAAVSRRTASAMRADGEPSP